MPSEIAPIMNRFSFVMCIWAQMGNWEAWLLLCTNSQLEKEGKQGETLCLVCVSIMRLTPFACHSVMIFYNSFGKRLRLGRYEMTTLRNAIYMCINAKGYVWLYSNFWVASHLSDLFARVDLLCPMPDIDWRAIQLTFRWQIVARERENQSAEN